MFPERVKTFSFKKHWHLVTIMLLTSLAIASETANFLFGNDALIWVRQAPDVAGAVPFAIHLIRPDILPGFCASESIVACNRIDLYVRIALFILLVICARQYWKLDIRNQELVELYRQVIDAQDQSPEKRVEQILQFMAVKKLKFRGSDRVSIYKYSRDLDCFFRVGRFSTDPQLATGGRRQYKAGQGIIGNCWSGDSGVCCVTSIPRFKENEKKELKTFLDEQEIGGIPLADLRSMRMQARSLYAYRIVEKDSGIKSAIIVFESPEPNRFSQKMLQRVLKSDYGDILKTLANRRNVSSVQVLGPQNAS